MMEAPLEVTHVVPQAVDALQPAMDELLERLVEQVHGEYTKEDIILMLQLGRIHSVFIHQGGEVLGLVIMELLQYPQFQVLNVIGVVGKNIKIWKKLDGLLDKIAADRDCMFIEGRTRPGMVKLCAEFGYEPLYTLIRRKVLREYH